MYFQDQQAPCCDFLRIYTQILIGHLVSQIKNELEDPLIRKKTVKIDQKQFQWLYGAI